MPGAKLQKASLRFSGGAQSAVGILAPFKTYLWMSVISQSRGYQQESEAFSKI